MGNQGSGSVLEREVRDGTKKMSWPGSQSSRQCPEGRKGAKNVESRELDPNADGSQGLWVCRSQGLVRGGLGIVGKKQRQEEVLGSAWTPLEKFEWKGEERDEVVTKSVALNRGYNPSSYRGGALPDGIHWNGGVRRAPGFLKHPL